MEEHILIDWIACILARLPKWFGERPGKKAGEPETPEGEEDVKADEEAEDEDEGEAEEVVEEEEEEVEEEEGK